MILQQVTSMARQMVTRFGMSNIGPLALESQGSDPFLGRSMGGSSQYSEDVASELTCKLDLLFNTVTMKQFKSLRTIELLLINLVDILIEKETISGEEFRNIVAEYTPLPEKRFISLNLIINKK